MEIVFILVGLAIGAALGWFIAQSRAAASIERARLATEQVAKLEAELTSLRARATELEDVAARTGELLSFTVVRHGFTGSPPVPYGIAYGLLAGPSGRMFHTSDVPLVDALVAFRDCAASRAPGASPRRKRNGITAR